MAASQLGMALAVRHQRRQQIHLLLGLEHGGVGTAQVVKVRDQRRQCAPPRQTASSMWLRTKSVRLPTDFIDTVWWNSSSACSLFDAKAAAEPVRAVGRESCRTAHPTARRRLRRRVMSVPKSAKSSAMDSAFPPPHKGARADPAGPSSRTPGPASPSGQSRRCGTRPGSPSSCWHRAAPRVWRCHWLRCARTCSGPARRSAASARAHRHRRPCCRPRGGRHQQRGDGIHQRGFARADVAGQQAIAAIERQRPDTGVEGAPVEDTPGAAGESPGVSRGRKTSSSCHRASGSFIRPPGSSELPPPSWAW
jgi:hypothetical protein